MKKNIILITLFLILIGLGIFMTQKVKTNNVCKIAFLGDSITEHGWLNEYGYVKNIEAGLINSGIKIKIIPAGKCGDTTSDMLQRLNKDVLEKNPDIMFFMGGINNIWFNIGTFNDFQKDVLEIINRAEEKNIKVILISLTIINEDLNSPQNKIIDEYNTFLKKIAAAKNIIYIDVNSEIKEAIKKKKIQDKNTLTFDGVHLNYDGNKILAQKILQDFLKYYK